MGGKVGGGGGLDAMGRKVEGEEEEEGWMQ